MRTPERSGRRDINPPKTDRTEVSPLPSRYLINTHSVTGGDHTGGDAAFHKVGATIVTQDNPLHHPGIQEDPDESRRGTLTQRIFNNEEANESHPDFSHCLDRRSRGSNSCRIDTASI
jgi:hypothetical protein